mgnify:CR=1 FL=1|tara:strand:+ start:293 stop:964 length:672 start_codon:yes stop_codon:yes gene_type:complete
MHQQTNKTNIYLVILFFLLTTFDNINIKNQFNTKIKNIEVLGLNNFENKKIQKELSNLLKKNIFFLDKQRIFNEIYSNEIVDNVSVFKNYPSKLIIDINKVEFLAITKKKNNLYYIGSNGKLIKADVKEEKLPFIYGDFNTDEFIIFQKKLKKSMLNYNDIRNLFFFKSKRWNIELKNGLVIKFPNNEIDSSLELLTQIFVNDLFQKVRIIDLRQKNQIIINE